MTDKEKIEMDIADTIIERPFGFKLSGRQFYLYPVTLGKTYLLARLMKELNVNVNFITINPYMEAIRLCETNKGIVCRLIAYHTIHGKNDLFNTDLIENRVSFLTKKLEKEEMAQLLVVILSKTDINVFLHHLGIDEERKRMRKVAKIKGTKGSMSFGGKSVYGSLISPVCEKYGWSYDYVVWCISYDNLKMLTSDSIVTMYLSDEEMKKAGVINEEVINADDPRNFDRIKSMKWD